MISIIVASNRLNIGLLLAKLFSHFYESLIAKSKAMLMSLSPLFMFK